MNSLYTEIHGSPQMLLRAICESGVFGCTAKSCAGCRPQGEQVLSALRDASLFAKQPDNHNEARSLVEQICGYLQTEALFSVPAPESRENVRRAKFLSYLDDLETQFPGVIHDAAELLNKDHKVFDWYFNDQYMFLYNNFPDYIQKTTITNNR
jgi:hypothetical protein